MGVSRTTGLITFKHKGDFKKTTDFLTRAQRINLRQVLDRYGKEGVEALSAATPIDSGETASSWSYEIRVFPGSFVISWMNSNVVDGFNVAIGIQYGHGTRSGGYIQGRDYINPAIQPIFDRIAEEAWQEVTKG